MSKQNVEAIKLQSQGLRGPLDEELRNSDSFLTEAAKQISKFHGIYQQHDRDDRKQEIKQWSFMIRTRIPGGQLTGQQYLALDALASEYANDTLRVTTRQTIQFHGVIKTDLKNTLRRINHALLTTLGACGDIVRNVIACPAPTTDPQRLAVQGFANLLSDALTPQTRAYHQIWLNDEPMVREDPVDEPLYGRTFLPRKFKIAIAFPGDNCVDVFTNDVGLVALFDGQNRLEGFNVLVGGGMGLTHNNEETFARLADVVGFVKPEQVIEAVSAIVTIHRDYGDRTNRKHARLKYVLHDWGVEHFIQVLRERLLFEIQPARPMPEFQIHDHLGWHEQGDGKYYLGLPIENGRIADRGGVWLRTGLREIIHRYHSPIRLTAQQNLILVDIHPEQRAAIEALLADHHIQTVEQFSGARRYGIACPALPTCGLAITEAERALPSVLDELEMVLAELGLLDDPISIRMTGCPNGCARPYVAEIAFVGRSLEKYKLYLGGNLVGTRLAEPFLDLVHINALVPTLRPLLTYYRDYRREGEFFGDFCQRIGFERLHAVYTGVGETAAD